MYHTAGGFDALTGAPDRGVCFVPSQSGASCFSLQGNLILRPERRHRPAQLRRVKASITASAMCQPALVVERDPLARRRLLAKTVVMPAAAARRCLSDPRTWPPGVSARPGPSARLEGLGGGLASRCHEVGAVRRRMLRPIRGNAAPPRALLRRVGEDHHADVGFDRPPTARFPPPLAPYRSDSARTASMTSASSRRYSSSPLRQ